MIFISHNSRAAGALAGLAVGDAFGAPYEGYPPLQHGIPKITSGGRFGLKAGEFTDDTDQALGLARSLLKCGGFEPNDVMRNLISTYIRNPRFYGPTSSAVFSRARDGCAPRVAAHEILEQGGGRSNGSVMRGAPLGIYYPPDEVWQVSLACSRLTHPHPVACECSAFVNMMISCLCRGISRDEAYASALNYITIQEIRDILGDPRNYPLLPSLDALAATHCAVTLFLHDYSYQETVSAAVMLGGDTDTIAAIAGAMSGSYLGLEAIPPDWIRQIVGITDVIRIAESLDACRRDGAGKR